MRTTYVTGVGEVPYESARRTRRNEYVVVHRSSHDTRVPTAGSFPLFTNEHFILMATTQKKAQTVVDIATGDKNFSTLVRALKSADLVDTLKGDGPFTIFAPTNAAFERLSGDTRDSIFKAKNKTRLQDLLKRHVVKGRHMAADVLKQSSMTPMKGGKLRLQKTGETAKIGNATLQQTDINAENGVVHVIDRVLRA